MEDLEAYCKEFGCDKRDAMMDVIERDNVQTAKNIARIIQKKDEIKEYHHTEGTVYVQYAKVDETHFSVTAKVEISDQFFGWILGFGKKAKLLYPDDVIDQFRGYMDKIREMY